MKNLRSYREMVGARYDHRLLLLVLPESCSLSLSFVHSLPRSMIASPFSTRTYLDRRNMATVCSVPLIKAHSLNCGLIKSPHYRKLPAPLLLEKSLFRISIDSIDDKKRWIFRRREKVLKFIHPHKSIEPLKVRQRHSWNGTDYPTTVSTNPNRATRFLSSNRLYPVTDYQSRHSPRIYLDARNMPPAGATVRDKEELW